MPNSTDAFITAKSGFAQLKPRSSKQMEQAGEVGEDAGSDKATPMSVQDENQQPENHHHSTTDNQPDLCRIGGDIIGRSSCEGEVVPEVPQFFMECSDQIRHHA